MITLEFRTQVHGVRLSRSRIIIVLQNSVHMYAFSSPPEKLSVFETADNPLGLCCLGARVLAFPGRTPGQLQIVEIESGNVSFILAHGSPLRAMDLSPDGEVVVTASETVCFPPITSQNHRDVDMFIIMQGTLIRVFSTSNCARIAELRRGIDHALIFTIAISPSSTLVAVTSDKSTLHIFDLPHPLHPPRTEWTNHSKQHSSPGSAGGMGTGEEAVSQKWGILSKIPLLPRVFSDIYSFASAHIETGDDPQFPSGSSGSVVGPIPGIPGGRPPKGILGWTNDHTVIVIGAGRDGRWERFIIGEAEDGKRHCVRDGWRRYLGGG